MKQRLSFHADARYEINEAAAYYQSLQPDLGIAFLDEVEEALAELLEFPKMYPLVTRTARRKIVHRFPYSIFYSVRDDRIRILAVAHQKRRPFYWSARH